MSKSNSRRTKNDTPRGLASGPKPVKAGQVKGDSMQLARVQARMNRSLIRQMQQVLNELVGLRKEIDELRNELRLIAAHGPIHRLEDGDTLVSRSQIGGALRKSSRTIAKYLTHRKHPLPEPYCVGEAGRAHLYRWSEIRVWALDTFGRGFGDNHPFTRGF